MDRPQPLVPGFRLDRYELVCPLAEGGMAAVWVARLHGKRGFERLVAIKTILPKYASDLHFEKMFLDEARIASGIDHTNVARIFDLGEEHEVLYLVMELVDGEALSKLQYVLAKKGVPLPYGVILRIMADACAGLHAAHELKDREGKSLAVVHRDVSPQNILLSNEGVAKVIDFGVAKALDRASADTSGGLLKGKLRYMAPEQALGQAVDRRADVWAVGAILYNFFAGRPAYDGDSQVETFNALTSGKAPPPLPEKTPPAITSAIMQALAFERELRFATAAEMQRALEDAMVLSECQTTSADVAAFVERHVGDRATARRQALSRAIAALGDEEAGVPPSGEPPLKVDIISASGRSSESSLRAVRSHGALVTSRPITDPIPNPPSDPSLAGSASESMGGATYSGAAGLPRRHSARGIAAMIAFGLLAAAGLVLGGLAFLRSTTRGRTASARDGRPVAAVTPSTPKSTEELPTPPADLALPSPPPTSPSDTKATSHASLRPVGAPPPAPDRHVWFPVTPAPAPPPPPASPPTSLAASPTPSPPAAAPPPAPAPVAAPSFDLAKASAVAVVTKVDGVGARDVRAALPAGRFSACYKDALRTTNKRLEGSVTVHLETDLEGRVSTVRVAGPDALAKSLGNCLRGALNRQQIRNVDTGGATADLDIAFKPE